MPTKKKTAKKKTAKKRPAQPVFVLKGKVPKTKARLAFLAVVYPDGTIGATTVNDGDRIETLIEDAREDAEENGADNQIETAHLAVYRCEILFTKPVVKTKPPKAVKAKVKRLAKAELPEVTPTANESPLPEGEDGGDEDSDDDSRIFDGDP